MYVRDEVAEVVRPIRELKGFKRIKLGARDGKVVKFKLTEEDLAYYHSNGCYMQTRARLLYMWEKILIPKIKLHLS